jgi:chromate transporter
MNAQQHLSPLKIFLIYLRLGCLSFGGPVAHFGYFKDEFVSQRKWLSEAHYAELLALCQFVPGPTSSQTGFAIGWHRGGLIGACAAWLGFTLPSAIIMIAFAYGLTSVGDSAEPLINGLLIAAVAVVAKAVFDMGRKLCTDLPRMAIALVSAVLVSWMSGVLMQIGVILFGIAIGNALFPDTTHDQPELHDGESMAGRRTMFVGILGFSALLLIALLTPADSAGAIYAMQYQAGALVFGGGHVVLPLLHDSVVPSGLLSESDFLAGYSAVQAMPGPIFTLSAFLGTASQATHPQWIGGLIALVAIFLPGMLLLAGLIPVWNQLRNKAWAQAGIIGANAAVVGLLAAALVDPVWSHGIQGWADGLIAAIAMVALYRKVPAWLVVFICGGCGYII